MGIPSGRRDQVCSTVSEAATSQKVLWSQRSGVAESRRARRRRRAAVPRVSCCVMSTRPTLLGGSRPALIWESVADSWGVRQMKEDVMADLSALLDQIPVGDIAKQLGIEED